MPTLALAGLLCLAASVGRSQTIADYSRAQRAMLEATMAQAAARSAGLGASAPTAGAPAIAAAAPAAPRLPAAGPSVQVNGVFTRNGGAVAEVAVNAGAYLLAVGQAVPGTTWRVEEIAVDRVVLARHTAAAADGDGLRRVFALPALR